MCLLFLGSCLELQNSKRMGSCLELPRASLLGSAAMPELTMHMSCFASGYWCDAGPAKMPMTRCTLSLRLTTRTKRGASAQVRGVLVRSWSLAVPRRS